MAGAYVPLVLIPRFTSYLGEGEYATAGLDVSQFGFLDVAFWRGLLLGDTGTGAALEAVFEESDDNDVWFAIDGIDPITSPNAHTLIHHRLVRRWLRVRVTLAPDEDGVAAITCWCAGHLELRQDA